SGLLGGLVGNQGGIRAAAMLGFDVKKERFVATATATALFVDAARVPIYAVAERREVAAIWPLVLLATVGTLAGTLGGQWMLPRVPEHRFRKVVGTIILFLRDRYSDSRACRLKIGLAQPSQAVPKRYHNGRASHRSPFVSADYHEKLEEDYLFPRFEKAHKLVDLTTVLRAQHQAGRRLTDRI